MVEEIWFPFLSHIHTHSSWHTPLKNLQGILIDARTERTCMLVLTIQVVRGISCPAGVTWPWEACANCPLFNMDWPLPPNPPLNFSGVLGSWYVMWFLECVCFTFTAFNSLPLMCIKIKEGQGGRNQGCYFVSTGSTRLSLVSGHLGFLAGFSLDN